MVLKIDAKFEGQLTCTFKNDMKNLVNFRSQTEMNSTIRKPFQTCSTDSTALRCEYFSKKTSKKCTYAVMVRIIITFANQIFL